MMSKTEINVIKVVFSVRVRILMNDSIYYMNINKDESLLSFKEALKSDGFLDTSFTNGIRIYY